MDEIKLAGLDPINREADKATLDAIARFAGSVAHDLNNLIGVITAYASCILREELSKDVRGDVEEILSAGEMVQRTLAQLARFAARPNPQPCWLDVGSACAGLRDELEELAGDVKLTIAVPAELPRVWIDSADFGLVVKHLVSNAAHESTGASRVAVSLARAGEDPRCVELVVSDDGCGMTQSAFEPLYTTKPDAAGLGLSTVLSVVYDYRAAIDVRTAPESGTTIRIRFPESRGERG